MKKLSQPQIKALFESRGLTEIVKSALMKMKQDVRHRYSKAFYLIAKDDEGKPLVSSEDYPALLLLKKERDTTIPFCDYYFREIDKDIPKYELAMSFAQFEYANEVEGKTDPTELLTFVLQATWHGPEMQEPENIFSRILRHAYYEYQIKDVVLAPIPKPEQSAE